MSQPLQRQVILFGAAVAASVLASLLLSLRGIAIGGPMRAPTADEQAWWTEHAPASFDRSLALITQSTKFGVTFEQFRGPARRPDGNDFDLVNRLQTGWPARAFEGYAYTEQRKTLQNNFLFHPKSAGWFLDAWIPYKPIWAGLAINAAAFYAALVGVTLLVGYAQRTVRKRRGQCAHCGYPLAGGAACPECGVVRPNQ